MSFELIETLSLGGTTSGSFENIPQDGNDLFVVFSLRSGGDSYELRVNNPLSNYTFVRFIFDIDNTSRSHTFISNQNAWGFRLGANNLISDEYGTGTAYFSDYANPSNNPIVIAKGGFSSENTSHGTTSFNVGFRDSNEAITRLEVITTSGSFDTHSIATLYKVTHS